MYRYLVVCSRQYAKSHPAACESNDIALSCSVRPWVAAKLGMGGKREDGGYGDYDTPEETFPDRPIPGTRT